MRRFTLAAYACIAAVAFVFYGSVPLSLAAGFLCIPLRKKYAEHEEKKRKEVLVSQFRDLLYSVSASVSAGRQMEQALIESEADLLRIYPPGSPIIEELGIMNRRITESRESAADVLRDFAERSGCADIRDFSDVFSSCRSTGGDVESVVLRTSSDLAEKI